VNKRDVFGDAKFWPTLYATVSARCDIQKYASMNAWVSSGYIRV